MVREREREKLFAKYHWRAARQGFCPSWGAEWSLYVRALKGKRLHLSTPPNIKRFSSWQTIGTQ